MSQALPDLDVLPNASDDYGHMRRDLPAGTVTFLFTDVEGSTSLLHELGAEAYAEALAEHRRVVRDACTARGGVEVDTQGDAFFLAFPTTTAALESARAITEELASGPITLRIGVHTGTPLLTDEGYVGEDVHFAARVAASAHGGQVVLSSATRALLDDGYPLVELGEHRLKDIPEPVVIFQLGDGQFPPLKTISNTNLPRPASSFVGRERELSQLLARIEDGGRLLTLTGPGGSGKTRLAIEAAATLVPEYKAGVFWVGLAALRDSALVSETIAQTLGAKDGLAEHIGEREMLLLLDNLEQVMESAPELSSLLQGCPNLTLLVTSRELLRVQGEIEYPVPPLAEAEAVSLFCERAQTEPSEEIAELCRHLDALPLAVELAAARTKALSPAQILERLSQRLDLLKGGRDADPRQQTLRATIEWSYDLLRPDEQHLFARLSVFAGGCTFEAAEEVCGADLDTLHSLVEKSLLSFSGARYWMLETIRGYAAERLDLSEKADEVQQRHATHFLGLAQRAEVELRGPNEAAWMTLLELEHDNLRAALASSLQLEGSELALRLACSLWRFWYTRGHFAEGRRWLSLALEAADSSPPELVAMALSAAARLAIPLGDLVDARSLAEQSVELFRDHGDPADIRGALAALEIVLTSEGDLDGAVSVMQEAIELAQQSGDRHGEALSILNLGYIALLRHDLEQAETLFRRSGELLSEVGEREGEGFALVNLALVKLRKDDFGEAAELVKDSLAAFMDVGSKQGISYCLECLAAVAAELNRPVDAVRLLACAEQLRDEIGVTLQPYEQALHDRTAAFGMEGLVDERLAREGESGRAMTLDEACAYALGLCGVLVSMTGMTVEP